MRQPILTRETEREIEDSFVNDREAHELLALIDAEFQSDPMSVQCFDLGIVTPCLSKTIHYLNKER